MVLRIRLTSLSIIIILTSCSMVDYKLLNEEVFLPPEYWTVHKDFPYNKLIDHESNLNIWEGLKLLRIGMFEGNDGFVFEIQIAGDLSLAKKFYGKSLQFDIDFYYDKSRLLICTANGLEKAVLISGDKSKLITYIDKKDNIKEIKHESNFELVSDLRLEIDRDVLKIYLPFSLLDKKVKNSWISNSDKLTWSVTERLALKKFKPVETKIEGVYFMPEIQNLWYSPGESIYEKMLYGVEKEK